MKNWLGEWDIDWSYVILGATASIIALGIAFVIVPTNDSDVWERSDIPTLEGYWGFENCVSINVIVAAYICEVPLTGHRCLVMPDPVVEKNIQALDCEWKD